MDHNINEIISSQNKAKYLENNFDTFLKQVQKRIPIFYYINNFYNFKGSVLEIGAGSCWFSAMVSKIHNVEKIFALDISEEMLHNIGQNTIKNLRGDLNKITFVVSDFSSMPFENKTLDVIICDASLHHAKNVPILLDEINRVLSDDGFFIATREPIKSIPYRLKIKKFGNDETKKGSTENIYSKKEWVHFFENSNLKLTIKDEYNYNDIKTKIVGLPIINIFNGYLFSRYFFYAKKNKQ